MFKGKSSDLDFVGKETLGLA